MLTLEIHHLKERARTLKGGLYDRLEEYHILDFPSEQPHRLIHLLQNILREIEVQIDNTDNKDTLLVICQIIILFGICLEFIDNAHTQQTPRALVKILETLTARLGGSSRLLARPLSDYNYTILSLLPILKNKTEYLFPKHVQEKLYEDFESDFKIISFPRIERDNILLHAIFGHELGHPIADDYLKLEESLPEYSAKLEEIFDLVDKEFSEELKAANSTIDKLHLKSSILDEIIQIRKRALEELISDCVAILIFGPSAIFASYEVFCTSNLDLAPKKNSGYYPPSRMRLRVQKKILDQNGSLEKLRSIKLKWLDTKKQTKLSEFLDHVDALCRQESEKEVLDRNKFTRIAYRGITEPIDSVLKFAESKCENALFDPSLINPELPELLERLAYGLPPSEIGNPLNPKACDWRSAILAAWVFKLMGLPILDSNIDSKKALDKLHEIVLLGIEHIFVRTEYETHIKR